MNESLFGRVRLGYVLIESCKTDAWRRFAADGIGLHVDDHASRVHREYIDLNPLPFQH